MLSNKHLTYPLCEEVTGTEENELTKGALKCVVCIGSDL